MKKTISLILCLSLLLSLLCACKGSSGNAGNSDAPSQTSSSDNQGSEPSGDSNVIKIGVLEPMTGASQYNGLLAIEGFEMYVDYYNGHGGIQALDGAKIELVFADTNSDPTTGVTEFERLAQMKDICAIIGPYNSSVGSATAPLAVKYGMPYMIANCTSDAVMTIGENKYVYRTNIGEMDGNPYMTYVMNYLDEHLPGGLHNIAIVYDSDDFGSASHTNFVNVAAECGLNVVVEEQITTNSTDLSTVIQKIKAANVDLVCTAIWAADHTLLTNQLVEYDCDVLVFSKGGGTSSAEYLNNVGENGRNTISTVNWAPTSDACQQAIDLNKAFYDEWGYDMQQESCWGWLGMAALIQAIEDAASTDREAIADALYNMDIDAATYENPFGEDAMFWFSYYTGVKYCTQGEENRQYESDQLRYNNNIKIGEGGGMAAVQIQDGKWELVMPTTLTNGEDRLYIPDYYNNR